VGTVLVERKDVVLAVLGASGGFAGLVLVFLGLLIASFESYGGDTTPGVEARYRWATAIVLAAFVANVAGVVLAMSWLLLPSEHGALYAVVVAGFFVQLGLLVAVTARVAWQLVWR
jgi:hypothetical protein